MSLVQFKNILRFIGGGQPTADEKRDLFKEAALMTLARATSADTNIKPIEVQTVQTILKSMTGEQISLTDIQLAAKSELFETRPLERYLAGIGRKLDTDERAPWPRAGAPVAWLPERAAEEPEEPGEPEEAAGAELGAAPSAAVALPPEYLL